MVEFGSGGMASPAEAEDAYLRPQPAPAGATAASPAGSTPPPSVEAWGTTPEAQRGQTAMMSLLGGAVG